MENERYLDELNEVQRQAVTCTEGPVMIIAGAGSGKTRVLTYRIAHLIKKGADPFNILALTFTNKAALEMKNRISSIVGADSKNIWMGTFHSVFSRILRVEAEKIGYPRTFTIYDTDDSKSLIKSILKELDLDEKVYKPSLVLNRISSAKNNLISASAYQTNLRITEEDRLSGKPKLGEIYSKYSSRCFKSGAMDFDDLLFKTNILLRDHPDVLQKYQEKFKYIMVDEYQDTNFSQYVIVKQLAARFENICVVGDDAQSIYSFRGATIQNILNFEKDYPDLHTFKLEQNYRSTQVIVNAANSIIANNKAQLEKKIWTSNHAGEKISVMRAFSDNDEGMQVARSIFDIQSNFQAPLHSFAILYRTNAQSRAMEEALRKLNLAYRIYGGVSFYQRKEIKDILAYYRLAVNPNDEEALKRIINFPARGIGSTTMDKISVVASDNDVSIWTALENIIAFNPDISSGTLTKINEFVAMIKRFGILAQEKNAFEAGSEIASHSGLLKELYSDKTPEGLGRYENTQELLNGIKEFVEEGAIEQPEQLLTLEYFIQDIALLTDADSKSGQEKEKEKDKNKISLMTIHASKGLEFPYVFIVGLEENLFPSQMALNSREELEEERRLFYVALTRAEKKASLSFATSRFKWGNLIHCEPSRFIEELDVAYVDLPVATDPALERRGSKPKHSGAADAPSITVTPKKLVKLSSVASGSTNGEYNPSLLKDLQVGMSVQHDRFGIGKVLGLDGAFPNTKALVDFPSAGQKQLLLRFAKLKVL